MPKKGNISANNILYVNRKIYFYVVKFKNNGKCLDPSVVFKHLDKLPFTDSGRYQNLDDTKGLSIHIDSHISPLKFRLGTRRLGDLPFQENQGNISGVTLLKDHVLFELSHFIIDIDNVGFENNIMAFEFNFYGPRIGKFIPYMLEKTFPIIDQVELLPLMNKDFETKIKKIGEIRKFEIGIQRNNGELLKELDESFADAIKVLDNLSPDSPYLEFIIRHKKRSKKPIKLSFIKNIEKLTRFFKQPGVIDSVDTFRVKAENRYSDEIETFDFLEEYLVSKRRVIKTDEKHRSVDTEAMYNSMNDAYRELKTEINTIITKDKNV